VFSCTRVCPKFLDVLLLIDDHYYFHTRKGDAIDIDNFDEYKDITSVIREKKPAKITIFVNMADVQKSFKNAVSTAVLYRWTLMLSAISSVRAQGLMAVMKMRMTKVMRIQ
jgi:hypothetical protein